MLLVGQLFIYQNYLNRNYSKLLKEVKPNEPVILTKNGYGRHAIIDLDEYERFTVGLEPLKIVEGTKESGAISIEGAAARYEIDAYMIRLANNADDDLAASLSYITLKIPIFTMLNNCLKYSLKLSKQLVIIRRLAESS